MTDLQSILARLRSVIAKIDAAIPQAPNPNDRYLSSSRSLIQRAYANLDGAVMNNNQQSIVFYLRALADMPKGIIDIGATWEGVLSAERQEISDIATSCHVMKRNFRTTRSGATR